MRVVSPKREWRYIFRLGLIYILLHFSRVNSQNRFLRRDKPNNIGVDTAKDETYKCFVWTH
jgi:hypothetical protein